MAFLPFVDTNVFLRHIRQDHLDHSPRATAYMTRIRRGELVVQTNVLVISEVVFTLQSFYRYSKPAVANVLLPLINLPGLKIPAKPRLRRALALYALYNVSFVDAYLAALAQQRRLSELVSFDRNYDRILGVPRIEP
ncbi:MAG TPA: PIN domain-containing protein [Casimicrobiaceae bacterium]|jgi:predicted nucleic acid-binding protein